MPEGLEMARPHRIGGMLLLGSYLDPHRHDFSYDKRQRDEYCREKHAGQCEYDLNPQRVGCRCEPAGSAEKENQHEPGNYRGHRERKIDEAVYDSAADEGLVAYQEPGDGQAK